MFSFLSRIRLLWLTIFAATLMLSVKVGTIVDGLSGDGQPVKVNQASAQAPELPGDQPPAGAPPVPPGAAAGAGQPPPPVDAAAPPAAPLPPGVGDDAAADPADDPTLFTQSEIDLLQQLADRREELEQRAEDLSVREAMLKAAEDRINRKIEEMRSLETTIQGLIKTHEQQEDTKVASLVRIYENMKPKDAARIFEELDLDTLLLVAERMKERRLAPVMAEMNPEKAKQMTVELSRLRQLPEPGTQPGT